MALNPLFLNQCFDKNRLKNLITWSLLTVGERQTIETVENLKALGFQFATQAGVSLSVDDLKIPPEKLSLVSQASQQVEATQQAYHRGNLTAIEKLQQLVDTWHRASETLKQTVVNHFLSTDKLNPVYMMAFSGARGNISQVRQLAGMRGLMADPQGQIIGFPIRSNFREGLTLTEYMISCYGARKGLVDTALRTADAGYLTRRLVDVSQHMIVKAATCATPRGIVLKDLQSSAKVILPLRERLIGRVLAEDVSGDNELPGGEQGSQGAAISTGSGHTTTVASSGRSIAVNGVSTQSRQAGLLAYRNQEISAKLAARIASCRDAVVVRSPLTCAIRHGVCQLCYGWSLSEGRLVTLGEAVGIIAAQSIGEPGTQLTMRTFHTGGVFSGDVMAEVRAPHDGIVDFPQPLQGLLIRTSHGKIAFLTKASGSLLLGSDRSLAIAGEGTLFSLEPLTVLFVRQHEKVARTQLIAEFSSMGTEMNETIEAKRILFSEMVGQVSFANVRLGTRRRESGGILQVSRNLGFVWVLSGRRSPVTPLLGIYGKGSHLVNPGSLVTRVANKSTWHGNRAPIRPESTDTQFRPTVSGVAPERLLVSKNRPHRPHRSSAFRRTGSSFRRTGSIALVERSQGRAYQNDGLVDASAVTRHNLVQTYTDETFSTPLRFVPNLGYCATFSTRRNGNSKPVDHLNIRHVYPAHPWSRSGLTGAGAHAQGRFVERDHLDGATELPDRQAKALQGRWHLQPVVATYRQMAPSLGSSPDCLLFASFPFRSLLQGHQGRYLDTDPFPQVRLLAPFDTGSLLHRGGFKVAPEQQGPKRLAGEAPTSVARPQRPTTLASASPIGKHGNRHEIVARDPDFYWLPGEQKSGQTGLAWVDSRYIGKKFRHGEIVWIDEQNLECHAIYASQALQRQVSPSKGELATRGQRGSLRGAPSTPIMLEGQEETGVVVKTRATLQGRVEDLVFETRGFIGHPSDGWIQICSVQWPELSNTSPLGEPGSNLFDQGTRYQFLGLAASKHPVKNGASFSKQEIVKIEGQHFRGIGAERRGQPNKTDTSKAEPDRYGTRFFKVPINTLQFVFATHRTNPLARKNAVGDKQSNSVERESQRKGRGFNKSNGKDAPSSAEGGLRTPRLETTIVVSRSAAGTSSPQQETRLGAKEKDSLKTSQVLQGQALQEPSLKSAPSDGFSLLLDGLVKGTNRPKEEVQVAWEARSDRLHLRIKPGWAYLPHEQANLLRSHESIQFCGGSQLDNLFFEPALVYLEAFKSGQFSYSTADTGLIASLRVQLLELGLVVRNMGERRRETGISPGIRRGGSIFQNLATQAFDIEREIEGCESIPPTHAWASHAPVSSFHRAGEKHFQSSIERTPRIWPLGQEILVRLRKMLWLSQAFAPRLAELGVDRSFLQALLPKRAGWEGVARHNHPNRRTDLYQMLFIRNLLNREPFLWLRAFPVQVQIVTNQKARHLGMVSPLHNRLSQANAVPITNLTLLQAGKEIEGVTTSERQLGQIKSHTYVVAGSELVQAKPHMGRGLLPLVQAEFLFPYGFTLGLVSSCLPVSLPLKFLKERAGTEATHKLVAATWQSARRIVQAVRPTRADRNRFQSTGWSTWQASQGRDANGVAWDGSPPKVVLPGGWVSARGFEGLASVRRNAEPVRRNAEPLRGLQGLGMHALQSNATRPTRGGEGGSSNPLLPQGSFACGPHIGKSWFLEPALANPSLFLLIRKGHRYPFSMLEKSTALLLRRHTLTQIARNQRLPIPSTTGHCLSFSPKQSLTPLLLGSPHIRFTVMPLVPFNGFQTTFFPRPLYWIRFAGFLSPSLCDNGDSSQIGSSSVATAGMLGSTALRTGGSLATRPTERPWAGAAAPVRPGHRRVEQYSATTTSNGATLDSFNNPIDQQPRSSEAVKKRPLSLITDGIAAVVSPSEGEMVSQWDFIPKSVRKAEGGNSHHIGQHPNGEPATTRGNGNVLFTQADHTSLSNKGHDLKRCVGEFVSIGDEIISGYATPTSGQIVAIEKDKITLRRTQALLFYAQGVMHVNHGEWVEKNAPILTLTYQKLITGDIVQGIPKIEQFFEAPATKEGEPLPNSLQARLRRSFQRLKQLHPVPQAVKRSLEEIQQILVEGILKVYLSQGVRIADKHLEIVIRQMISKGQVLDVGNTGLFQGEHVRLDRIERINLATYGQKADYEPAVLGITQASLDSESFISAASFQETTRVLSRDTIIGKTDFLRGLKERVVLGDLIQAGTGVDDNINYGLLFGIAPACDPAGDAPSLALL